MCIAFVILNASSTYPVIVAFNREELLGRDTVPLDAWGTTAPQMYAGKDLKAGGSWLGVSSEGRVAFLTNYRETGSDPGKRSRGFLVKEFLEGRREAYDFCRDLHLEDYNGFNLVVGDISAGFVRASNRQCLLPEEIRDGVTGKRWRVGMLPSLFLDFLTSRSR